MVSLPRRSSVESLRDALCAVAPRIATFSRWERAKALRQTTLAAVDELKSRGLSAERVHAVVQGLASDAGIDPLADEALDDLTAWCIQRYFASGLRLSA